MQIPDKLLSKYNSAVPRYTSYPPANHFREFTEEEHLGIIKNSNSTGPQNIAIYVHIPFCRKICYYCGCNSCSLGKGSQVKPYIEAVKQEIRMVSGYLDKSRRVSQIHFGGGTPNAIDLNYLAEIIDLIKSDFSFIDEPEIAIECNPDHLGFKETDQLMETGFNRFSIGIQDFNSNVLRLVNRGLPVIDPSELFGYIKQKNSKVSVNFDFIYGLPGQTADSFTDTIRKAIEIRPDRIVTFSYAHVPWLKRHQLILEKKGLPQSSEKMLMFEKTYSMLGQAGYEPLGLDHYVLPEDDLFKAYRDNKLHRNFQGYCTRRTTGQVYAFGVTGISQLEEGYSQNSKEIEKYLGDISKGSFSPEKGYVLTGEQKITRTVITNLMCNKKIVLSDLAHEMNIQISRLREIIDFRQEKFSEMENDGLLVWNENGIDVTENGTMFIRNIAVLFDRDYIEKNQTYSRTV
ncbi:MAG TPA: oxygen-independent coproporphyrinogen III oxidase [Bacteroidales bacterium]|nr:oxygen-independent coproporphyrinogen III oxidase [Bacteroidales bacterium]